MCLFTIAKKKKKEAKLNKAKQNLRNIVSKRKYYSCEEQLAACLTLEMEKRHAKDREDCVQNCVQMKQKL